VSYASQRHAPKGQHSPRAIPCTLTSASPDGPIHGSSHPSAGAAIAAFAASGLASGYITRARTGATLYRLERTPAGAVRCHRAKPA
jgi:hypothetical protein